MGEQVKFDINGAFKRVDDIPVKGGAVWLKVFRDHEACVEYIKEAISHLSPEELLAARLRYKTAGRWALDATNFKKRVLESMMDDVREISWDFEL